MKFEQRRGILTFTVLFALTGPFRLSQKCRKDWLDAAFLRRWSDGLSVVREVPTGSPLGADLLSLV